jgi:hypothetical protein
LEFANAAKTTKAPSPLRSADALHSLGFGALRLPLWCVFVVNLQAVDLEIVDGFNLRGCCCPLKPRGTAPRISVRYGDKSMVDSILKHVPQSRQITFLVGKSRITKVVPNLSSWRFVELINPLGSFFMQAAKHAAEAGSVVFIVRRMSNKMVVIGKDSPSFQTPIGVTANCKQSTMKHPQTSFGAKSDVV